MDPKSISAAHFGDKIVRAIGSIWMKIAGLSKVKVHAVATMLTHSAASDSSISFTISQALFVMARLVRGHP